ncbi:MAG: ATP-binding cassette domain-containing protein [Oscillospiraceae bacterium]|nr:ATP-binding cassette domain-containing protein [Oscillospiraceae bacterium]MCI8525371.1 ATP-binding cassette domain-containing protein [Oscillospiraceae bacterium]
MNREPLVRLDHVKKYFAFKEGLATSYVKAVDGITLDIFPGETMGLVGESGCGKSTLGRTVLRLFDKVEGRVLFEGTDLYRLKGRELVAMRRNMQIVFQDPLASLNPRKTIRQIIEEPLRFHGVRDRETRRRRVDEVMEAVGLSLAAADRYPHEFSGGQQQRAGIARALVLRPRFIVCDEAVSALDVSVQAQVLNLLQRLKKDFGLTYLFISHNLSVVKHVCDRVAVMYLGRVVEVADKTRIFENPIHPYTRALISAIPIPDPDQKKNRILLEGDLPSPADPPPGCHFHPRCGACAALCGTQEPALTEIEPDHFAACHCCCGAAVPL